MSRHLSIKAKRAVAIIALPALVAGVLFLAQPANAAAPGNIDPKQIGSIIVHKHEEHTTKGDAGTGNVANPAPQGAAIKGVTFTVQKLNLDLTKKDDWDSLAMLDADTAKARVAGDLITKETDAAGQATFDGLAVGAYLVTETNAPAGVFKKAAPFIVTVPHPNGNGAWNYNVHVYPKNSVSKAPTKKLKDGAASATKIGDKVTWIIEQILPVLSNNETFTEVSFEDQLQENLTFLDGVAMVDGREVDSTIVAAGVGNRTVTGDITDPSTLQGGQKVTFELTTSIDKPGKFTNTAVVKIKTSGGGDSSQHTPTPVPGVDDPTVPTIVFGYFDIYKYVAGTTTELSGATFELYKGADCVAGSKVDLQEMLTTIDTGKLVTPFAIKTGAYSLKETVAPVGYVLSDVCTDVVVTEDNITMDNPAIATVYNSKATVPVLPMTGAQGQVILLIAGGVLVLAGVVAVVAVRSKRQTVAAE
ncbi:isopeptide-forming domain-containing fimbrial protein [Canibacter sp. lx-72]|uniref:SpaH/EbpB family LPXTG-anchored major pilin n=1 Tax=Canibacter zhuwentaonis TaxID=2837491 RepID=UPI001BDDB98C|nr:SpaH/EbpB family LPXTG-anchored major pilin [Canibacter zhuwentaonis]MBT1018411.1 isopeptide-forming domain-containing fimbrial protein [Canibacter zhuwentaonis]